MFQKTETLSHDAAEDFLCQEQTRNLFGQPDVLLIHEYLSVYQNSFSQSPEMKLMAAVLKDGIDCYIKSISHKTRRGRKVSDEAEEWIFGPDDDRLYSFQSVCDMLKIDANYIRGILLRYKQQHAERLGARTARAADLAMDGLRLAS